MFNCNNGNKVVKQAKENNWLDLLNVKLLQRKGNIPQYSSTLSHTHPFWRTEDLNVSSITKRISPSEQREKETKGRASSLVGSQ